MESYHTITDDKLVDMDGLVDLYIPLVKEVVETRNVVCLTGFCAGGEQALALAIRLYNDKPYKPRVVVLDGELDRDISLQEAVKPAYFFPFYDDVRNNARADLDIRLMATMPEEAYKGPVTSIISDIYTDESAVSTFKKTPEMMQREKEEFFTNEARWKRRYPDCELIKSPTNHNEFLITRESKDFIADYFLHHFCPEEN